MMRISYGKRKPKRRWKNRGICKDAATLGVNRNTLYKLLAGYPLWQSKSLRARYTALKLQQSKVSTK
jgi:hypothetical protein